TESSPLSLHDALPIWIVFATSALDDARERIGRLVVQRESISIADVRDLLRTSRKYILPIVNRMDAEGVTRRRGDLRIPGPRARRSEEHTSELQSRFDL